MPIGTFIAGGFLGTWTPPAGSPAALGLTEQGYRIRHSFRTQEIAETDIYGETPIEVIYRGGRLEVGGLFQEVLASIFRLMFPFAGIVTPTGVTNQQIGVAGILGSSVAGALVLTAAAGTPAIATPATQTFPFLIPAGGFEFERVYNSKLRQTPFQLMALPKYVSASDISYWSAT